MHPISRRNFLGTAALAGAAASVAHAFPPAPAPAPLPIPFRLGTVTYNIAAQFDIPTLLRFCTSVGLSTVELRTTHKHGVEPSLSADERATVKKRFADAGIEIWGCGSVCEFHATDSAVVARNVEQCKQFCDLVKDIGGKGVKVRPNGLPQGVPVEQTLAQIGKALTECGRTANDCGVEIWVEVHGPGTSQPAHCKTIMEHANHPAVGLTWNSNPTDVTNGSVAESFKMLRPWIKSCHINELHSGYPYRELFGLLRETGYDRVTLAEIQGMPDYASAERLMKFYKGYWTELCR